MRPGDLTTLRNVKMWLPSSSYTQTSNISVNDTDTLLTQLISRVSGQLLSTLMRSSILPKRYVEDTYDGSGSQVQFLRNWPVLEIEELKIDGQVVNGYSWIRWDGFPPGGPSRIERASKFTYGKLNVKATYIAGYQITDELNVVPQPGEAFTPVVNSSQTQVENSSGTPITVSPPNSILTLQQPYGIWAQDIRVTYNDSTKTPLVRVSFDPVKAGQYKIVEPDRGNPLTPTGLYMFHQGDRDVEVLITYGYIPSALEQVAIDTVVHRYQNRQHIGEVSRTITQQVTTKYDMNEFPEHTWDTLQRFSHNLPI